MGASFSSRSSPWVRVLQVMTVRAASLTFLVFVSLFPVVASAQPGLFGPVNPAPVDTSEESPGYTGRIVVADLAAATMFVAGVGSENGGLAFAGATTYLVAPAIVHLSEGRSGAAVASVGLRVALPVAGATIGYKIEISGDCRGEFCGLGGVLVGGLVGGATAVIIDQFVLAGPHRHDTANRRPWVPTAAMTSQGGTIGLAGAW